MDKNPVAKSRDSGPRRRGRRWLLPIAGFVLAVCAAIGWYAWQQYQTLTSSKYRVVDYTVPTAPRLVAVSGETVYRIDPTESSLSYAVNENLFGEDLSRARGRTSGIAGDVVVNTTEPGKSRMGRIVVNVEQLRSDNSLRDARVRATNLESHRIPLAYLDGADLHGLPSSIVDGRRYRFTMPSRLTVKQKAAAATWAGDAGLKDGKLLATATTTVKMSTFGIGPISVAGIVSTADAVTLTLTLTALDPSKYTVPTTIAPPASEPRSGDSPSFKSVVLPAMEANCASCHRSGEVGAAHWTFDRAGDAQKIADGIGTIVNAGYMPPSPASSKSAAFAHSRRLDPRTVAAIVKWAKAGGPLDVPATRRVKPRHGPSLARPRHDVVLAMPASYTAAAGTADDYRCFVLDPHFTAPTFVTGFELTPGARTEIHHAQLFHADAGRVATDLAKYGQDGRPGWSCYVGASDLTFAPGVGFAGQAGLMAAWIPGQDPVLFPQHSGILFQPGDAVVLQIHYHYNAAPNPDRTTVALQLDPGTAPIEKLDIVNPVAPVEIPCAPGDTAPLCDRAAALAQAQRTYGVLGAALEPGLLSQCRKTVDGLLATAEHQVARSSCDHLVSESGRLVMVLGHMHMLGRSFRMTLDPDTPSARTLLDIPRWQFNWQMNYELQRPIHVLRGQKIRIECSWDRALDPNRPSKYIVFAEGTSDEMCFGTYGIIRDSPSAVP